MVYASAGGELIHYELNAADCALIRRGAISLPADVQYAWGHASHRYLYVATSNGGPGNAGDRHFVCGLQMDATTGALQTHGAPVPLRARPIHITLDIPGRHALISYNAPSSVTVHEVAADGRIGDEVEQQGGLDFGIYPHQTRIMPDNKAAIVVTRGNDATPAKAEDPGALKRFGYHNGKLTPSLSFAPAGGYGYGPRHLDFHPTLPLIFVSLERQNGLHVYRLQNNGRGFKLLCAKKTLAAAGKARPDQRAGAIHIHPSGRWVYVVNRASRTRTVDGRKVFIGGENNIAIYKIDQSSGAAALIQHIDTRGNVARTFAIDPTGRVLIAANLMPVRSEDGCIVPASLALFRIGADGRLDFVRKYDMDARSETLFWMGMATPGSD